MCAEYLCSGQKKGDRSQRASCRVGQELEAVDRGLSPAERPLVVVDSQTPSSSSSLSLAGQALDT